MRRFYEDLKYYDDFGSMSNLDHVCIGVSSENQEQADKRIPIFLEIPATIRFVSVEPILGEVTLNSFLDGNYLRCGGTGEGVYEFGKLHPCIDCHGLGRKNK